MKISIALATYNGEKYLRQQLDSFLSQDRQPDELVVCDDCSTDKTMEMLYKFAESAPFKVRIEQNPDNLGYPLNFSKVLSLTEGDLVFLSDQDDVWFKEKIAYMERLAMRHSDMLLYMHDLALVDDELTETGLTKLEQVKADGLPLEEFLLGCCCVVRRELLDLCLPVPRHSMGHDRWLVQFADGLGKRLVDPRVLQYYRRHDSNVSGTAGDALALASRFTHTKKKIRSAFLANRNDRLGLQITRHSLFLSAAEKAAQKARPALVSDCHAFIAVLKEQLGFLEERGKVRDRQFLPRFALALGMLMRGRYRRASGVISFARDVWG